MFTWKWNSPHSTAPKASRTFLFSGRIYLYRPHIHRYVHKIHKARVHIHAYTSGRQVLKKRSGRDWWQSASGRTGKRIRCGDDILHSFTLFLIRQANTMPPTQETRPGLSLSPSLRLFLFLSLLLFFSLSLYLSFFVLSVSPCCAIDVTPGGLATRLCTISAYARVISRSVPFRAEIALHSSFSQLRPLRQVLLYWRTAVTQRYLAPSVVASETTAPRVGIIFFDKIKLWGSMSMRGIPFLVFGLRDAFSRAKASREMLIREFAVGG